MTQESTPTPIAPEVWLSKVEHTAWRKLAGETVVLDLHGHRMFGFNEAAAAVWSALVEHPVPRHVQGPATAEFLDRLLELDLVQVQDTASESEIEPVALPTQDAPAVLWQEKLEQAAATCAFLPGQNVLCGQVPFS